MILFHVPVLQVCEKLPASRQSKSGKKENVCEEENAESKIQRDSESQ